MDPVFGSRKLNRKALMPDQRRSVKQHFDFNTNLGFKSKASPSVVAWRTPGKGVSGESVNATNEASKKVVNRNWRPI